MVPKVAASIAEFFSERANRKVISATEGCRRGPEARTAGASFSTRLAGKSFVFTGALARRSREEAGALVVANGGKVSGSVSKNTDYVVVGADPGSKAEKAKTLGVAVLNEDDFDALIEGKLAIAEPAPPATKKKTAKKKAGK